MSYWPPTASTLWKIALLVPIVAAITYASSWITRELTEDSESRANLAGDNAETIGSSTIPPSIDYNAISADQNKPKFQGEMLGLYIAPPDASIPEAFKQKQDALRASAPVCTASRPEASFQRAGGFDLSFSLPAEYAFDPAQSGLIICSDTDSVGSAHWVYRTKFNGYDGAVEIVRGTGFAYYSTPVASDRISVIDAGGHSAVLIAPVLRDTGYGPAGVVIFVDDSGITDTTISSTSVSLDELLKVADAIGEALTRSEQG